MKKRWLLRLGLFAGVTVLGFWFVMWLTAPEHRIQQSSVDQIKKDMTESEVSAIIRVPPGDYSVNATLLKNVMIRELLAHRSVRAFDIGLTTREWISDTGAIQVSFDKDGKVVTYWLGDKVDAHYVSFETTLFDRIRGWLRLP